MPLPESYIVVPLLLLTRSVFERPFLSLLFLPVRSTPGNQSDMDLEPKTGFFSPTLSQNAEQEGLTPAARSDGDDALKFLAAHATLEDAPLEETTGVLRKVDWMIMPLMLSCFTL